jgi:methylated-DNA-[protein]-cysteine S-methyltransferase
MSDTILETILHTPLGEIIIEWKGEDIAGIHFGECRQGEGKTIVEGEPSWRDGKKVIAALCDYFDGKRVDFSDIPLNLNGATPFLRSAWEATREIPYGETWTYGELTARVGKPGAARAAGMAMSKNRFPVVIPCHRVVGHDGSLVGFGGKIEWKEALLGLEQRGKGRVR